MKIAVITHRVPSTWAHSINTLKHAQGFLSLGHKVEILTVQGLVEIKNRFKISNVQKFYNIDEKINIKYFTDKSPLFFKDSRFLRIKAYNLSNRFRIIIPRIELILNPQKRISEYIKKKKKYDLAYCRETHRTAFYNILNKIPTVIEDHFYYALKPSIPDMNLVFKICDNKFFRGIVTTHEILKKQMVIKGVPEEKILILEDVVDLDKYDFIQNNKKVIRKFFSLPLNKKIILYIGSLKEGKGIRTILDSTKFLTNKNYRFIILGGMPYQIKMWRNYIKKNEISADIKFMGFKENIQIPFYLKSADILLAPFSMKSHIIEWFSPIKIFEYMASKVPIIASDVERLREICNNNECLFFKVDDAEDLSIKINKLIENEELQEILVHNAYKKVKNYTYKKRCKMILNNFSMDI